MEYFWYVLASALAGVGTGLAGLSAATVMVPILIVLCPSFAGETGAYQATAIALASDVLGSAVTAWVYIRHGKIDLKRGWIMLVCILSMCTVGSFAAWLAGNVILGGFTLALTFCIGIRFLLKPDTQREDTVGRGAKLDWKGIAVSLFFGLTIGFGSGFVGTGGGMMMLVVFTAFLGMELKTAVGTSTFIMTFTALIASVSHVLIHPAILLERWDVMVICIVTATVFSLVSARFANRVSARTVGLVTGAVLTALGAAMILLNYWTHIAAWPLWGDIATCLLEFLGYLAVCVALLLLIRRFLRLPSYVFRKLLHLTAFTSVIKMALAAEHWLSAVLVAVLFALMVYPILKLLENRPWFAELLVEKRPGEIKNSLMQLFFTMAAILALAWGLAEKKYVVIATLLMWGFGDAAAALVGIPWGKHHIPWRLADEKKTREGSGAMALVSFAFGAAALLLLSPLPWPICLLAAALAAVGGTVTELVTRGGYDTVTVPTVDMLLLLAFAVFF